MYTELGFNEISDYIMTHYGQAVSFSMVDQSTIIVTATVKVMRVPMSVPLTLHIDSVNGSMIKVSYSGKYGVDFMVTGVVKYLEARNKGNSQFLKYEGSQSIMVYLNKIDGMKGVFDAIKLVDVNFKKNTVCAEVRIL